MLRLRRLSAVSLISLISFVACTSTPLPLGSPAPRLTPTLLGTANPPTRVSPSATPQPDTCIFRPSPIDEIGLYRFNWDNATITLDTKLGPIIVDGPRTLTPGPRQLILVHNAELSAASNVSLNFDVGGTLIYDLANDAQETRDAGGTVLIQSLTDTHGDTLGLPAYLDIIRVERTFGYYPNTIVRVYLAGVHTGDFIWTFQSVSVSLGTETYTQQKFYDGKVALTVTDTKGRTKDWAGPVTEAGNAVSFTIQTGWDDPVAAATITSSGGGDTAGPFPVEAMQRVWDAVKEFCP